MRQYRRSQGERRSHGGQSVVIVANRTHVAIVTPAALKFEGDAELVVAPGAAGDLGALANHAPLLTTLRPGVVKVHMSAAASETSTAKARAEFAVDGGFMEVLPDKVIILTDVARARDEVSAEEARNELRRAEEALAQKRGADDKAERRAVAWAQALVEVSRRPV